MGLKLLYFIVLLPILGCATGVDTHSTGSRTDAFADHLYSDTVASSERESDFPLSEDAGLPEYIRIALSNNAGLRSAFQRWQAALERVPQVTSLPDPQLTYTYFVEEVQTRTGPQENRFQLSQKFPWFSKLKKRGDVASERAESMWWMVETRSAAITRDVKVAWYEYAYLAQAIRIVRENLTLLQNLEPIVQRRVQTGAGHDALLRLQVEIGKVENDLDSLRDRRPAISARLDTLLNRATGPPLPWPKTLLPGTMGYTSDELRQAVQNSNPELASLSYQILAAAEQVKLSRLDRYPDFMVGVSMIDTGEAVTPVIPSDSGDDPVMISLGLSLPIWGRKYSASFRQAQAERSAAEDTHVQRQHDLNWSVEQNLYEFDDAKRQMTLYQDTLIPRSRQALRVTEVSYESGNASLLDVIDTQRELLLFEKSYWRAVSSYHQRLAALEALCGGKLP